MGFFFFYVKTGVNSCRRADMAGASPKNLTRWATLPRRRECRGELNAAFWMWVPTRKIVQVGSLAEVGLKYKLYAGYLSVRRLLKNPAEKEEMAAYALETGDILMIRATRILGWIRHWPPQKSQFSCTKWLS